MNGSRVDNFLSLACPTCGARLQVSEKADRATCPYCGTEHFIHRDEGSITAAPFLETMDVLRKATDRAAAELAIKRIKEETAILEQAKLNIELRLAQLAAKLAEHDKRRDDIRFLWKGPLLALVFFLGYYGIRMIKGGFSGSGWKIGMWMCLAVAVLIMLGWIQECFRLVFDSGIKPTRQEVERDLETTKAEMSSIVAAINVKVGELQEYLKAARTEE